MTFRFFAVAAVSVLLVTSLPSYARGTVDATAADRASNEADTFFLPLAPEQETAISARETTISIRTNTQKAQVYLNGTFEGNTPLVLKNLAAGQYHLRVEKAGYVPNDALITIARGKAQSYFLTLEPAAHAPAKEPAE